MLDPLTALSLASSVVQLTEFGIKLVTGSVELYHSANGSNAETSDLEVKIAYVRKLAEKVDYPLEPSDDGGPASKNRGELRELAKSCKSITSDLVLVLDGLKVKKSAGAARKWESLQKAVAAQTPWNKDKIASLDKRLRVVQQAIFNQIQSMMR